MRLSFDIVYNGDTDSLAPAAGGHELWHLFGWPISLSFDLVNLIVLAIALIGVLEFRNERRRERVDREIARESSATALYTEYLKIAFEHPKYSLGLVESHDPIQVDQYDSFLSILMYALDEGIAVSGIEHFRAAAEFQIKTHIEYIWETLNPALPPEENYRSNYREGLLSIVDDVFRRAGRL